MWDVEWAMRHDNISPTDLRSTQMPFGLLVNNTNRAASVADRKQIFSQVERNLYVEC